MTLIQYLAMMHPAPKPAKPDPRDAAVAGVSQGWKPAFLGEQPPF